MEAKHPRLSRNLLLQVMKYLDYAQIFKQGMNRLNKALYFNDELREVIFSKMLMQRLGVVDDFLFELRYAEQVLSRSLDPRSLRLNYKLNDVRAYIQSFKAFTRKDSRHKYLFGFQSIGGTEFADVNDPLFQKSNVNHLFIDADGYYNSSTHCDPCLASGIFYDEPAPDRDPEEKFLEVFSRILECS